MAVLCARNGDSWMTPIIRYIEKDQLPPDLVEARRTRARAARYTLMDGILYRAGHPNPCYDVLTTRRPIMC